MFNGTQGREDLRILTGRYSDDSVGDVVVATSLAFFIVSCAKVIVMEESSQKTMGLQVGETMSTGS